MGTLRSTYFLGDVDESFAWKPKVLTGVQDTDAEQPLHGLSLMAPSVVKQVPDVMKHLKRKVSQMKHCDDDLLRGAELKQATPSQHAPTPPGGIDGFEGGLDGVPACSPPAPSWAAAAGWQRSTIPSHWCPSAPMHLPAVLCDVGMAAPADDWSSDDAFEDPKGVAGKQLSSVGDVEEEAQVRQVIAASLADGGSATGSSAGGSAGG